MFSQLLNMEIQLAGKILTAALQPMEIRGQECRVSASIGIAIFPNHARDEQSLMRNADTAMYLAKREGKNRFQFYVG
jgi:diguanylate cyclase (GGDEF)-like protein